MSYSMFSKKDAIECRCRLIAASGLLPVGDTKFESDFSQYIIGLVANFKVIDSVRYWELKANPDLSELPEDPQTAADQDLDIPF